MNLILIFCLFHTKTCFLFLSLCFCHSCVEFSHWIYKFKRVTPTILHIQSHFTQHYGKCRILCGSGETFQSLKSNPDYEGLSKESAELHYGKCRIQWLGASFVLYTKPASTLIIIILKCRIIGTFTPSAHTTPAFWNP